MVHTSTAWIDSEAYGQIGPYVALSDTQRLPGGILPILCHFWEFFVLLYSGTVPLHRGAVQVPYHSPEVPYKCRTTPQKCRTSAVPLSRGGEG